MGKQTGNSLAGTFYTPMAIKLTLVKNAIRKLQLCYFTRYMCTCLQILEFNLLHLRR